MTIATLEAIPYTIPYVRPLHLASGAVHEADHVLGRLTTDDGFVGTADAPPRPYTCGETQKSVVAVVGDLFATPAGGPGHLRPREGPGRAHENGWVEINTERPAAYQIPTGGVCGQLIGAAGRHA